MTFAFLRHLPFWDKCRSGTIAFLGKLLSWDICHLWQMSSWDNCHLSKHSISGWPLPFWDKCRSKTIALLRHLPPKKNAVLGQLPLPEVDCHPETYAALGLLPSWAPVWKPQVPKSSGSLSFSNQNFEFLKNYWFFHNVCIILPQI